jgi:uncharacterized protein (DUF2062 family)
MKFKIMRPLMRAGRSRTYQPGMLGWSLGIGLFVGFSPTVGMQVVICIAFCLAWNYFSKARMSMPAMVIGSFVVNPLTMAPTYLLYYQVGCQVMECRLRLNREFFISLDSITELGFSIAGPIILGSLPFMIVGLPVGIYLATGSKAARGTARRRPVRVAARPSSRPPIRDAPGGFDLQGRSLRLAHGRHIIYMYFLY